MAVLEDYCAIHALPTPCPACDELAAERRAVWLEAAAMAEKEQHVLDNMGKEEAATYFYRFANRLREKANNNA